MPLTTEQKKNLRNWIKALRSGKYEQGKGLLRSKENKFCCLGVACDLANPRKWRKGPGFVYYEHDHFASTVTESVRNKYGFTREQQSNLINLNDHKGKSFKYIASYIERHILKKRKKTAK